MITKISMCVCQNECTGFFSFFLLGMTEIHMPTIGAQYKDLILYITRGPMPKISGRGSALAVSEAASALTAPWLCPKGHLDGRFTVQLSNWHIPFVLL